METSCGGGGGSKVPSLGASRLDLKPLFGQDPKHPPSPMEGKLRVVAEEGPKCLLSVPHGLTLKPAQASSFTGKGKASSSGVTFLQAPVS